MGRAIDQPRPVDVVPASAVREAIDALGPDASVSALADHLHARWALTGSMARTGNRVQFSIAFEDVESGERLRDLDPISGSVDSLEVVMGRLADAAAAAAVSLLNPDLPPWASMNSLAPSVAVYRQHLAQFELFCQGRFDEAIELGGRVFASAPDYVPALQITRASFANQGRLREADSVTGVLAPLRDQMTTMERAQEDWLRGRALGDQPLALRSVDEMYRFDPAGWGDAAGVTYLQANRLRTALERYLSYDVDAHCGRSWRPWWVNTAATHHLLEQYEEELSLVRRGLERFPGYRLLFDREAAALAALGRLSQLDSLLGAVAALPPEPSDGHRALLAGLELRAHGQRDVAARFIQRGLDWYASRPPDVDRASRGEAFLYAERWADADTLFAALRAESPDNVTYLRRHGLALARLGRPADAQAVIDRLVSAEPPGPAPNRLAAAAEVQAALGKRDEAVRLLGEAFEAGYPYSATIHRDAAFEGMRGYAPWENLVRPRP
jgi:tetratricopeptide (TPR) repeat protein